MPPKSKNVDSSCYAQFRLFAEEKNCICQGVVGYLPHAKHVRIEAWTFPYEGTGGFMLAVNQKDFTIGVYGFVGTHGDPVIRDIEWLNKMIHQKGKQ